MDVPAGSAAEPAGTGVLDRVYRLAPGYDIRPIERSSASTLQSADPADEFGTLEPRPGSGLEPRTISADTALLLYALQTAGQVPAYALRNVGVELTDVLRRFVLDGILQVLDGASFVDGPAAASVLGLSEEGARGDDLAVAALRYAQRLTWLDEHNLAMRIYTYGRRPLTPALARRHGAPDDLRERLGLGVSGTVQRQLGAGWTPVPASGEPPAWWQWLRRSVSVSSLGGMTGTTHKLYVSPDVERVADVLPEVAALVAGTSGCTGFKVGAGLAGLCRPDKVVLYFARFEDLQAAGWALAQRIDGCPAHGVPFTADVTADGLLSWGVDPPVSPTGRARRTSWRMWLAQRLAEHLRLGASCTDGPPWRFALSRMRLSGVDTATWIPTGMGWSDQ